jgi:glutamine cyclotransferase
LASRPRRRITPPTRAVRQDSHIRAPPRPRRSARLIAVASTAVTATLAACDRGDGSGASAPPAVGARPATNADAVPPRVPFDPATPRATPRVLASWPHDTAAYTQGLLVHDGRVLEGTGQEGRSEVRDVDRETGRVRRRVRLPAPLFGEGIAVLADRLYQLTWLHGRGYVYDVATLALVDSVAYEGEGWGLATDGARLYLSDGSSRVRVIDPSGFRTERVIQVHEGEQPVWMLNELEWVRGELWANVYETDLIARIDPATGTVIGWVDVGALLTPEERRDVDARGGVANGIAYDSARGRLLVTGKLWPRVFEFAFPETRLPTRQAGGAAAVP